MSPRKRSHDHESEVQDRPAKTHKVDDNSMASDSIKRDDSCSSIKSFPSSSPPSSPPTTAVVSTFQELFHPAKALPDHAKPVDLQNKRSEVSSPHLNAPAVYKRHRDYDSEYSDSGEEHRPSKVIKSTLKPEVETCPLSVNYPNMDSFDAATTDQATSTSINASDIDPLNPQKDTVEEPHRLTNEIGQNASAESKKPTEGLAQKSTTDAKKSMEEPARRFSRNMTNAALISDSKDDSEYDSDVVVNSNAKSKLIPLGKRRMAVLGTKDESVLHMLCKHADTGKKHEQHFKKIVHSDLDWNNKTHIMDINGWRTQLYGRAGMGTKTVYSFHPDEVAWFELYYNMALAKGRQSSIRLPPHKDICLLFNEFFDGKILQDESGNNLEPRVARKLTSVTPKATRIREKYAHLEADKAIVKSKSGSIFKPVITQDMLDSFKQQGKDLPAQVVEGKPGKVVASKAWNDLYASFLDSQEQKHVPEGQHCDQMGARFTQEPEKRTSVKLEEVPLECALNKPEDDADSKIAHGAPKVHTESEEASATEEDTQMLSKSLDQKAHSGASTSGETVEVVAPVLKDPITFQVKSDSKAVSNTAVSEPEVVATSTSETKSFQPAADRYSSTEDPDNPSVDGEEASQSGHQCVPEMEKAVVDQKITCEAENHTTVEPEGLAESAEDTQVVPIDAQSSPSSFSMDEEISNHPDADKSPEKDDERDDDSVNL